MRRVRCFAMRQGLTFLQSVHDPSARIDLSSTSEAAPRVLGRRDLSEELATLCRNVSRQHALVWREEGDGLCVKTCKRAWVQRKPQKHRPGPPHVLEPEAVTTVSASSACVHACIGFYKKRTPLMSMALQASQCQYPASGVQHHNPSRLLCLPWCVHLSV